MSPENVLNNAKILIIDDHAPNLEILSCFLKAHGVNVAVLNSGKEAAALANKFQPDLILLDIMMPGLDGFATCQALKKSQMTCNIPIIFASALSQTTEKIKGFEIGAIDYITKPFVLSEVKARLIAHLTLQREKAQLRTFNLELQDELQKRKRENHILQQTQAKLEANNKTLQKLATIDALTQIGNRRCFEQRLHSEWRRSIREKTPLSLMMCDIDFFKNYNDYYGHQQGDTCLQKIAFTLFETLKRPSDLICRYGGEEFAIILPNTHAHGAQHMAEKIRQAIENLNLPHQGVTEDATVNISVGVSTFQALEHVPESQQHPLLKNLLEQSDQALYQAKKLGRNCSVSLTLLLDHERTLQKH